MLVLTRKSGESIKIGDDITITIVEIKSGSLRLGIEAPPEKRIFRKELYEKIREENLLSSKTPVEDLSKIEERLKSR